MFHDKALSQVSFIIILQELFEFTTTVQDPYLQFPFSEVWTQKDLLI